MNTIDHINKAFQRAYKQSLTQRAIEIAIEENTQALEDCRAVLARPLTTFYNNTITKVKTISKVL